MLFDRLKIFKKMRGALEKTCIWDNLLVERIIFLPVFSKFGASKLFNAKLFFLTRSSKYGTNRNVSIGYRNTVTALQCVVDVEMVLDDKFDYNYN